LYLPSSYPNMRVSQLWLDEPSAVLLSPETWQAWTSMAEGGGQEKGQW